VYSEKHSVGQIYVTPPCVSLKCVVERDFIIIGVGLLHSRFYLFQCKYGSAPACVFICAQTAALINVDKLLFFVGIPSVMLFNARASCI